MLQNTIKEKQEGLTRRKREDLVPSQQLR